MIRWSAARQASYRRRRAERLRWVGRLRCAERYELIARYFEQPWPWRVVTWLGVWVLNWRWPGRERGGSESRRLALKYM